MDQTDIWGQSKNSTQLFQIKPNPISHPLVTPNEDNSRSKGMQYPGRHYVRYFNQTYQRTGTLFESRFISCIVQQISYFLVCLR